MNVFEIILYFLVCLLYGLGTGTKGGALLPSSRDINSAPRRTQMTISQWAVIFALTMPYSSQYDNDTFSAAQALGEPDVYPAYGDLPGAWKQHPDHRNGSQFIRVLFNETLFLSGVAVYETFNAGGIKRILARVPGSHWQQVYNDTVTVIEESRIFSPQIQCPTQKVNGLWIEVDCMALNTPKYVQIDAVRMDGRSEVGCGNGHWGQCCTDCGNCWDNNQCDHVTGFCPEGSDHHRCSAGYKGYLCVQECIPGQYGADCLKACGNCSNGTDKCDRITGHCPDTGGPRCAPGFEGVDCQTVCKPGKYGADCVEGCGNCFGGTDKCDTVTGHCPDTEGQRCAAGFEGVLCQTKCTPGKHGSDCLEGCGNCFGGTDKCDRITGHCPHTGGPRCEAGFDGVFCQSECANGTYGTDCLEDCGNCLGGNNTCDRATGHCPDSAGGRCAAGFTGELCKTECPARIYATDCLGDCGNCSEGTHTCDRITGQCTDNGGARYAAGCTGDLCKTITSVVQQTGDSQTGAIVGGLVAAIVATVVVAVVVFVVVRRRRNNSKKAYGYHEQLSNPCSKPEAEDTAESPSDSDAAGHESHTHVEISPSHRADCYNVVTFDVEETAVSVGEFWDYVRRNKTSDVLKVQYERLPSGLQANCEIAKKPENKGKGRYQNIVAYDHSRVVLEPMVDEPHSDYVNACYVHGYDKEKTYIASQGPTAIIVNDFCRMLWQTDTGKVVMLTNLTENMKYKCEQYWPNSGTAQFGTINITLVDERKYADFTIRTLQLTNKKEADKKKLIKQFHFTAWPDHGVPTSATGLLCFREKVHEIETESKGPIVVHCSAGIGRTGTFIGLDYLVKQAKVKQVVDVVSCARLMRQQRVNMIQTVEQFVFLHEVLAEAIKLPNTTVPGVKFTAIYRDLCMENPTTQRTMLREQFQVLEDISQTLTDSDGKGTTRPENMGKNRNKNIVAADSARIFLSTPVPGCTDYINAVFLPSYTKKRAFIVTQMPLPDTVVDFWRLVYEQDVTSIVMLNVIGKSANKAGIYWSDSKEEQFGPFDVTTLKRKDGKSYVTRYLQLKYKNETKKDNPTIKQFQCTFWPSGAAIPDTCPQLIGLMEELNHWHQQTKSEHVLVHCMDGALKSGLFCVANAVIERLKFDQDVSIIQTIKQMRTNRPELVRNLDQFKFIHELVKTYLENFQTYANFS